MSTAETKNKGAVKGGNGNYVFDFTTLQRMDAGVGYSSAEGPVVEGERIQVGLISMKRGTGARAHTHPNEQWIYLMKGKARVKRRRPARTDRRSRHADIPARRHRSLYAGAARRRRPVLHLQGHVARHHGHGGRRHDGGAACRSRGRCRQEVKQRIDRCYPHHCPPCFP